MASAWGAAAGSMSCILQEKPTLLLSLTHTAKPTLIDPTSSFFYKPRKMGFHFGAESAPRGRQRAMISPKDQFATNKSK